MLPYIIIHHTSSTFEVALFTNNVRLDSCAQDKRLTSKLLLATMDSIITQHNFTLADIRFIGINQGPGLFSTLRSIIATVNGLHFACAIPLIGIDALKASASEFYNPSYPYTATLLDACNNEVYYLITHQKETLLEGYDTIGDLLTKLATVLPAQPIHFVGNGTALYRDIITQTRKDTAHIESVVPVLCSLDTIAYLAAEKYNKEPTFGYLFPLHLKKHPVERT